jgi:seryl-tRNA synthetase
MLDIKFIRENQEKVKAAIKNKGLVLDLDTLLQLDKERVAALQEREKWQVEKNKLNDLMQKAKAEERKEILEQGKNVKEKLAAAEADYKEKKEAFESLMYKIPNIPSEDTPIGKDETENKVLRQVGEIPQFDFQPKEHWQLGTELGLLDSERSVKVSGSRFIYLKGELVLLEFALMQFALSVLTDEEQLKKIIEKNNLDVPTRPFVPVLPPVMIRPEIMNRMARLDPEEMYSWKEII